MQQWVQSSSEELINLYATPQPPAHLAVIQREGVKGRGTRSNSPQEFSPTEWEDSSAAWTNSGECANRRFPEELRSRKSTNTNLCWPQLELSPPTTCSLQSAWSWWGVKVHGQSARTSLWIEPVAGVIATGIFKYNWSFKCLTLTSHIFRSNNVSTSPSSHQQYFRAHQRCTEQNCTKTLFTDFSENMQRLCSWFSRLTALPQL